MKKKNKIFRPLCERNGKILVCSHNVTESNCPYLRVEEKNGILHYVCYCNVVFLNLFENE